MDFHRVRCPFCGVNAKPAATGEREIWHIKFTVTQCPACEELSFFATRWDANFNTILDKRLYPIAGRTARKFENVPREIMADYQEACEVLSISSKAAATLARRVLQTVLREAGYEKRDLAKQIEDILAEADGSKRLPLYLNETLDAVRNFGNFSAHRINDETTLQLLDVEQGEADWCIDLIERVFDHYYERPAAEKAKIDALNAKLQKAGKPPVKKS
jgi:hypothetical protein